MPDRVTSGCGNARDGRSVRRCAAPTTDPWEQASDDELVERLIGAMQKAVAELLAGPGPRTDDVVLPAPEMTVALLNLLAGTLEPAPACRTPAGMRKVSEAAAKELLVLMRGFREVTRPATSLQ